MIIGIIGCGDVAKAHVQALSNIENVTSLTLYDVNQDNITAVSKIATVPVKVCKTIEELANDSDGFVICTPNNLHVSLAEEVLKYKPIPFVCEKPISTDYASAERLVKIAPRNSIVSFNYRYNRIVKNMINLQKDRNLGKLNFFSAEFNRNSAFTRNHVTWRDSAKQSKTSGALGDLSCHFLDLFCFLAGDTINIDNLKIVQGTRIKDKSDGVVEVDDNGYIFGNSTQGAFFRIKASKSDEVTSLGLHINVVFEKGEINYSTRNKNSLFLTLFDQIGIEEIDLSDSGTLSDTSRFKSIPYWSDSIYSLLEDWCKALQNKPHTASLPELSLGLHIQKVLESF